jgi:hypothetical protein
MSRIVIVILIYHRHKPMNLIRPDIRRIFSNETISRQEAAGTTKGIAYLRILVSMLVTFERDRGKKMYLPSFSDLV